MQLRVITATVVCLTLMTAQASAQPSVPRWGQSPLPADFNSRPAEERKLILARRLVDALHVSLRLAKASWAAEEDVFRAGMGHTLSGVRLNEAVSDFEQAADESRMVAAQERTKRYAQYFSTHVSEADLHEALDFYASPSGQKIVLAAKNGSAVDRQQFGRMILAHPGMGRVLTAITDLEAAEHQGAAKSQLLLAQTFQVRLCGHLSLDHIQAVICDPRNAIR